jgi:transposase-like protein
LILERGLPADHTTIWRWVQRYAPELNRRCRCELKPTNGSWRVDETYICQGGNWRPEKCGSRGAESRANRG